MVKKGARSLVFYSGSPKEPSVLWGVDRGITSDNAEHIFDRLK